MSSSLSDAFLKVVVEARDEGIESLADRWFGGWRPKSPDGNEAAIGSLIDSLDDEGKNAVLACVRYFIDYSFFRLLLALELGSDSLEFELSVKDVSTGEVSRVVDNAEDRDLRRKYWLALSEYGR
jgi:hypothetical protein